MRQGMNPVQIVDAIVEGKDTMGVFFHDANLVFSFILNSETCRCCLFCQRKKLIRLVQCGGVNKSKHSTRFEQLQSILFGTKNADLKKTWFVFWCAKHHSFCKGSHHVTTSTDKGAKMFLAFARHKTWWTVIGCCRHKNPFIQSQQRGSAGVNGQGH